MSGQARAMIFKLVDSRTGRVWLVAAHDVFEACDIGQRNGWTADKHGNPLCYVTRLIERGRYEYVESPRWDVSPLAPPDAPPDAKPEGGQGSI
jgi:hypothetical protein